MVNWIFRLPNEIRLTGWRVQLVDHTPRQEVVDAIDLVVGDVGQDIICLFTLLVVIQRASANQGLHRGLLAAALSEPANKELPNPGLHDAARFPRCCYQACYWYAPSGAHDTVARCIVQQPG